MFKRCFMIAAVAVLTSCSGFKAWFDGGDEESICPVVKLDSRNLYITNSYDEASFAVSLQGYEGHCYAEARTGEMKAVIVPVVRVKRLKDTGETDVHFSYYTETLEGPPNFLGRKSYHTYLNLPFQEPEMTFRLKPVERSVPEELRYEFDVRLGLDKSL